MSGKASDVGSTRERLQQLNRLYDKAELACAADLKRYDGENEQKKRRRVERFHAETAAIRREAAGLVTALALVDPRTAAGMVLPEEPSGRSVTRQ